MNIYIYECVTTHIYKPCEKNKCNNKVRPLDLYIYKVKKYITKYKQLIFGHVCKWGSYLYPFILGPS